MNKKQKGLVCSAVGAALLLAAGGTFALWYDTADLGVNVDSLATGNLRLADHTVAGAWYWNTVSHSKFASLLNTRVGARTIPGQDGQPDQTVYGRLVPGDVVEWRWTDDSLSVLLVGDTIVADLYLDGVQIPTQEALEKILPLELRFGDGQLRLDEQGRFVIASGLTAQNTTVQNVVYNAPTITVEFPIDYGPTPPGYGHLPNAPLHGYGRDQVIQGSDIIDLSRIQIRLQQITAPLSIGG